MENNHYENLFIFFLILDFLSLFLFYVKINNEITVQKIWGFFYTYNKSNIDSLSPEMHYLIFGNLFFKVKFILFTINSVSNSNILIFNAIKVSTQNETVQSTEN